MSLISRNELRSLAQMHDGWCVSIYMPTHRAGPETQQDSIRLKNLLGRTAERLEVNGLRKPEIETLLKPAEELLPDQQFWQQQRDGLAIFLSSDIVRIYRLPFKFETLTVVTERFHLKPLLPLLSAGGRFYVLALSQDEIRLFQATRYSMSEIELQDVPPELVEFLKDQERERHLQFHTATRTPGGRGGERPAFFHGHGVLERNAQADILHYFQRVDEGLQTLLGDEPVPLVLAAVDYLLPIYQQANTYPHLLETGVQSHPDALSLAELHAQAWAIVEPRFLAAQEEAEALYKRLSNVGDTRASHELTEVVPAAYYERVAVLFVELGAQCWGAFEPKTQAVEVRDERRAADEDLLDLAAVHTFLNRGTVYAVPSEEMPTDKPVAAIFRY